MKEGSLPASELLQRKPSIVMFNRPSGRATLTGGEWSVWPLAELTLSQGDSRSISPTHSLVCDCYQSVIEWYIFSYIYRNAEECSFGMVTSAAGAGQTGQPLW